jgi:hypothetical protein
MLRSVLVFLVLAMAPACSSQASVPIDAQPAYDGENAIDAGPDADLGPDGGQGASCTDDYFCARDLECVDGHCGDVCEGVAGGTACNVRSSSDTPPECCAAGSKCCDNGFEHQGCYPADAPCPTVCARTFGTSCAAGAFCEYHADGLSGPGCVGGDQNVDCVAACPAAQQCGASVCCGAGTHCAAEYCCAPDTSVDAGVTP